MSSQQVIEILKVLFPAGIGVVGTGAAYVIILFLFPEKIEKWQGILWGWAESIGLLWKRASKEKIRHSIQGTVLQFVRQLGYELPEFEPTGVRLEWVDTPTSRRAFIDQGKAVIRLRREDPSHENIAAACMIYVSDVLLRPSSRHLSPTQRHAVQLYLGYKILEAEGEHVYNAFVQRWLAPGIEKGNPKIGEYFDKFKTIDAAELFLPVFVQELIYLGQKVFARARQPEVSAEVDGAVAFLEMHALRRIGQKLDELYYNGEGCRFAIMIVGISPNIQEERYEVYTSHIAERLVPCGVETIYLIGPKRNASFMARIAEQVRGQFTNPFTRNYSVTLYDPGGLPMPSENHLCVLRRIDRTRYVS